MHLLCSSSFAVQFPNLIEKLTEFALHILHKLSLGFESLRVVHSRKAIVNLLVPSEVQLFLVEYKLIAEGH
jgi:hypothetical protein